jgi:Tfp pilus assembly protein PilN
MGTAAAFRNIIGAEGPALVVTLEGEAVTIDRLDNGRLEDSRQFALPKPADGDPAGTADAVAARLRHPLFLETLPGKALPPVWIEGPPESLQSVAEALEARLRDTRISMLRAPSGSSRPFGLALLGLGAEKMSLELSEEEAEGLVEPPRYRTTAALFLLLLAVAGAAFFIDLAGNYRTLQQIEGEVARLKEEKTVVEVLSRQVGERRARLDFIRENVSGRTSQLELLRELTGIIPDDTYLTDYNFRDGKLEISGLSPSASKLIPLLEASPYFEEASFASAIISQGQELERFKIRLKLEERGNG